MLGGMEDRDDTRDTVLLRIGQERSFGNSNVVVMLLRNRKVKVATKATED